MTTTICNTVASFLSSLTATSTLYTDFGATLTFGGNLFLYLEPDTPSSCITIIPYAGPGPDSSGYKYESYFQIRVKSTTRQKVMNTGQGLINSLHNKEGSSYKIYAQNSIPYIFDVRDNGAEVVSVANYRVKHIRV